jgi:hypothetical protein
MIDKEVLMRKLALFLALGCCLGLSQTAYSGGHTRDVTTKQSALCLHLNVYGTRLEQLTCRRQEHLKGWFSDDRFFQMSYRDQKRIIDGFAMPRKFKKEFKGLIQGKEGFLIGREQLAMFRRVEEMLNEVRDKGQTLPMQQQKALEKIFESNKLLVRTRPKFGQGKGTVSYEISGSLVPQSELRYEDLVDWIGKLVDEGFLTQEVLGNFTKHLSDYKKNSMTIWLDGYYSLKALMDIVDVCIKSQHPKE